MEPLNPKDKLIRNYFEDSAAYCECWEFEDEEGETYTICQDQNGGERVKE